MDYNALLGELAKRSVDSALAAGENGETLAEEETALGTGRWVELGDRSQDFSKVDPWNRLGHSKSWLLSP